MEPFSQEWAEALCLEINGSAAYAAAAREWRWPLALVLDDAESRALVLDLFEGACRSARVTGPAEADAAPYAVAGERETWTAVLEGRLDPVGAILGRRLRLRGDLVTVMRFVPAARELLECARRAAAPG